ncbi:TPA: CoA ester lyase [bacterium]|jgi:citrate lyase subunit beta/citryl-CoA lyase|nr:CoA ester lyase [bacterium]
MRRSLLFIPASKPAMLQNAEIFGADSIIFDLEDSVSVDEKDSARILLSQFLISFNLDKVEVCVRVNDLHSPFFVDDLNAMINKKVDTIVLPKANVRDVEFLDKFLLKMELERNILKTINIIPIIETCEAVNQINEIVKINRVNGLLLGGEDLTNDLEVSRTIDGWEIFYPRTKIAYACKARGIDAIDTPYINTLDEEGLILDTKKAKSLGLNAKCAIHPNQVSVINEILSPSIEEIEYASRVMIAVEKSNDKGVFSLDGKMIDKPIINKAKKVLEKAKKFGLKVGAKDEK